MSEQDKNYSCRATVMMQQSSQECGVEEFLLANPSSESTLAHPSWLECLQQL